MNMKSMMRYIAAALTICLALAMTACSGRENGVSGYKVTVQDTNGNPVAGALVVLCQDKDGGICYLPVTTDEEGVARFLPEAVPVQKSMKVRVLSASGFELPLDENGDIRYTPIPDGTTEITLTLQKKNG